MKVKLTELEKNLVAKDLRGKIYILTHRAGSPRNSTIIYYGRTVYGPLFMNLVGPCQITGEAVKNGIYTMDEKKVFSDEKSYHQYSNLMENE